MNKEKLLDELEKITIKWNNTDSAYEKLRELALKIGANDLLENFVDSETLDTLAKDIYHKKGLQGVREFLYDVESFEHDVFYISNLYSRKAENASTWILSSLWYNLEERIKKL